jgi:hypothetical protein
MLFIMLDIIKYTHHIYKPEMLSALTSISQSKEAWFVAVAQYKQQ